jgi:c-di-GMP-binding flagellar brake protein YcgR
MTIVEKRKFPRLPYNISVKIDVLIAYTSKVEETQAKNTSVGGICIVIVEKVKIGALVRLRFSLPGETKFIAVRGKVVWIEEFSVSHASPHKAYDCGVEFLDITPQDQEKLNHYITARIKK